MDSLTQIVLGAAVGEVFLGKKIGNKAMLWGAIAGTIPDLDVYQSLFYDKLTANELHRGFSHSILFSIIFAPILAWLVKQKEKTTLATLLIIILGYPLISAGNLLVQAILVIILLALLIIVYRHKFDTGHLANQKDWTRLMFWSLITHPILDCHTTWGTQLLWPLKVKLAWNNIFVLDPLYTVPLLILVTIAMFYSRQSSTRKWLVISGISISSLYIIWSLGVKWHTYTIFEKNLANQGIEYSRLTTVPTPFNTFLWSGTADSDSFYYNGLYSIFDKEPQIQFSKIPTYHKNIAQFQDKESIDRLIFLSKNWYVLIENADSSVNFNDARFGPMYVQEDVPQYGFGYRLLERNGELTVTQPEPEMEQMGEVMTILWNRIWGK